MTNTKSIPNRRIVATRMAVTLTIIFTVVATVSACAADPNIRIVQAQSVVDFFGADCAEFEAPEIKSGTYDVGLAPAYMIRLLLGYWEAPPASETRPSYGGESDLLYLTLDRFEFEPAGSDLKSFAVARVLNDPAIPRSQSGGALHPTQPAAAGGVSGSAEMLIVGREHGDELLQILEPGERAEVVLSISMWGTQKDGTRMTSTPFSFPVAICNGCLGPPEPCLEGESRAPPECGVSGCPCVRKFTADAADV